jgi:hypothetical protein
LTSFDASILLKEVAPLNPDISEACMIFPIKVSDKGDTLITHLSGQIPPELHDPNKIKGLYHRGDNHHHCGGEMQVVENPAQLKERGVLKSHIARECSRKDFFISAPKEAWGSYGALREHFKQALKQCV